MGKMKDIGLLDCEDRPSIEENFKRVQAGGGGGGKITPDWNASEGEEGYINNRTHYEENKYITIAEEQTVSHSSTPLKSSVDGYYNSKGFLDGNKIVVGNTYIVYVDGVAYEGVAYEGAVSANSKKVCIFSPNGKDYTVAPISITVGTGSGGTTCGVRFSDGGKHTVKVELYEHHLKTLDPKFLPKITIVQDGYDDATMGVMATITAAYTCTANATFLDVMQMMMTKTLPPVELYTFNERGLCHCYGGDVTLVMGDSEPYLSISFFNTTGYGDGYKGVSWYYGDNIEVGDY